MSLVLQNKRFFAHSLIKLEKFSLALWRRKKTIFHSLTVKNGDCNVFYRDTYSIGSVGTDHHKFFPGCPFNPPGWLNHKCTVIDIDIFLHRFLVQPLLLYTYSTQRHAFTSCCCVSLFISGTIIQHRKPQVFRTAPFV